MRFGSSTTSVWENLNGENLILNGGNNLQVMKNENKRWNQRFMEELSKNHEEHKFIEKILTYLDRRILMCSDPPNAVPACGWLIGVAAELRGSKCTKMVMKCKDLWD